MRHSRSGESERRSKQSHVSRKPDEAACVWDVQYQVRSRCGWYDLAYFTV